MSYSLVVDGIASYLDPSDPDRMCVRALFTVLEDYRDEDGFDEAYSPQSYIEGPVCDIDWMTWGVVRAGCTHDPEKPGRRIP
jgi:hypothetical protein